MPNVDELNVTTLKLLEVQVEDNLFKNAPFFKGLKDRAKPFSAGTLIQNPFLYQPMIGGAYADGEPFNIDIVDVLAASQFKMKRYEVNVSESLEKINIENGSGDLAKIKIIDAKMEAAVMTMGAKLAIAANRHGQASSATVNDDRVKEINGWSEGCNDGVTTSWDGNEFPIYGGETRVNVGAALNSVPRWFGDSTGAPGAIGYGKIIRQYMGTRVGNVAADLMAINKFGFALILEKMQVQQRLAQENDPMYGPETFRVMGAKLVCDDYFPSYVDGVNDANLGNYLTANVTSATPASLSGMPTTTTLQVNEVLGMFRVDSWDMWVSNSALFGFGFTGFKVAQDSTVVAGQHLAALNLLCRSPRHNNHSFGFNS